jgi:anti-sigma B factor antagonist
MIVEKRRIGGHYVLAVEGVIKLGESAQFLSETLERMLDDDEASGGHVLLDLERINYIDSTGIGELVGYLARFKERSRRLVLVRPSERIVKLLQVAQLADLFPTYDDLDAAVAAECR